MLDKTINEKIEQIVLNLEEDRKRALDEFEAVQQELKAIDPKVRHLGREVAGQLLRIAIDASINMAKILEPAAKDLSVSSGFSKKELILALESMDETTKLKVEPLKEPEIIKEVEEEVINKEALIDEIEQMIDANNAALVGK